MRSPAQRQLDEFASSLKSCDTAAVGNLCSAVSFSPLAYGVSLEVFSKACFGDFTYVVGSAKRATNSEGNEIETIAFGFTAPDGSALITLLESASDTAIAAGADAHTFGYADEAFAEALAAAPFTRAEKKLDVVYVHDTESDTWTLTGKETLASMLLGGIDVRQEVAKA